MGTIELTCPLDSIHHLESAHNRKLYKPEYVQLLDELDRLKIPHCYKTVEVSVLGHFQPSSIAAIKDVINLPSKYPYFPKEVLEIFCSRWPVPQFLLHREYFMVGTLKNGQSTRTVFNLYII